MKEPEEFVCTVPSLDAYPRVRYFYRHLKSLVPRFKRVAGALPKCFHNTPLNKELDDILESLNSGVRVTVFGNKDIDRTNIVISSKGQETQNAEIIPRIDFCHVKTKGVSPTNVTEVYLSLVDKCIKKRTTNWNLMFLYCEIPARSSKLDAENFKAAILSKLNEHRIKLLPTNLTVGTPEEINTAEQISHFLETLVIQGFVRITNYLDQFVSGKVCATPKQDSTKQNILHILQHNVLTPSNLQDLAGIPSDMTPQAIRNQNIVLSVSRVIKCLLVPTLAEKFNMSVYHCNTLMCDENFMNRLSDAMEVETKSSVDKIANFIIDKLEKVLPEFISDIEKEFQRMKRYVDVMRKMKYEVHGYTKQTKVHLDCNSPAVAPKIPDELRQAIQRVEGVFGFGTFYGQIEIHITPILTDSGKSTTETEIEELMIKYRFGHPYVIHNVTKKPNAMCYTNDPGDKLIVRTPPFNVIAENGGTLGGYIIDRHDKVYALTCAHVVGKSGQAMVFVNKDEGRTPLSRLQNCFAVGSDDDFRFIDIAVAHVLDSLQETCIEYLRNPDGHVQGVKVRNTTPEELVGTTVFKDGAFSGKSYGIIGSVDYGLFGLNAGEYLIVIYPLPDLVEDVDQPNELDHSGEGNDASGLSPFQLAEDVFQSDTIIIHDPDSNTKIEGRLSGTLSYDRNSKTLTESQSSVTRRTSGMNLHDNSFTIYVRRSKECIDEDMPRGIFAERGDSGSIVCTSELSDNNEEVTAISMVSAGDFFTSCHQDISSEGKCLSFRLQDGLEKLESKFTNIRW